MNEGKIPPRFPKKKTPWIKNLRGGQALAYGSVTVNLQVLKSALLSLVSRTGNFLISKLRRLFVCREEVWRHRGFSVPEGSQGAQAFLSPHPRFVCECLSHAAERER